MTTATLSTTVPASARIWVGRALMGLPIFALTMSAFMKLTAAPPFVEKWMGFGFTESMLRPIGILELFVVAMYAVPRTRVLGAILVTGYLGGAIVTHVRVGDPFVIPLVIGILAWLGLWLTEPRLGELTPLRRP